MSARPNIPELGEFMVLPLDGGLWLDCPRCEWRADIDLTETVRMADLIEGACDHIVEHACGGKR